MEKIQTDIAVIGAGRLADQASLAIHTTSGFFKEY